MQWQITRKRAGGEVITTSYRGTEPRNTAADPAFSDFNYPLPPQDSPGTTGLAVLPLRELRTDDEDAEDVQDARNALNEPGERKDYEDFRRQLGLD